MLLPRDAMHKRGLCHRAVSVRPSVTFEYSVETNKHIFKIFSPSGHSSFSVPNVMAIFRRGPLTRASNSGRVGKNCDYRPISGFIARESDIIKYETGSSTEATLPPSWNCICRHCSAAGGSIWTTFGTLMRNSTPITMVKVATGRKIPIWRTFVVANRKYL